MRVKAGTTAQRLSTLARLYEAGQSNPIMDRTLDKLVAHDAEEAKHQLAALDADLVEFVTTFGGFWVLLRRICLAGKTRVSASTRMPLSPAISLPTTP